MLSTSAGIQDFFTVVLNSSEVHLQSLFCLQQFSIYNLIQALNLD